LWNRGEKLSAVGDSASINLSLPGEAANGFGTGIGLFFASDLNPTLGVDVRLYTRGGSYVFNVNGLPGSGSFTSSGSLTVEMTAQTPTSSTYSVSYSGNSSENPFALFAVNV